MATNEQTISATITTEAGEVEVRATVAVSRITISQCVGGSWHHAGDGKIRDGKIVDCAARLGLAGSDGAMIDATEEAYEALEEALADALSDLAGSIYDAAGEDGMVNAEDALRIAGQTRPECHGQRSMRDLAERLGCARELVLIIERNA